MLGVPNYGNTAQRIVSLLLVLAWMSLIFWFSAQPAIESGALSLRTAHKIANVIATSIDAGLLPNVWSPRLLSITTMAEIIEPSIRKLAHLGMYTVLGLLLWAWARCWKLRKTLLIPFCIGAVYAAFDEWHQMSVLGRSGELRDVLLDSVGVALGIALCQGFIKVRVLLRPAACILLCCCLGGCFTGQAKSGLLSEQVDMPAVKAPELLENCDFLIPAKGLISSHFGMRMHPILAILRQHAGMDIAAAEGTAIVAAASGKVTAVRTSESYGICVDIEHESGICTRYAHMESSCVKPNELVEQNTPIGTVGNTGLSTGPHLHFEIRVDGKPVDPEAVLTEKENPQLLALRERMSPQRQQSSPMAVTNIKDALVLFTTDVIGFF